MQLFRRLGLLTFIALPVVFMACDESESTLGGLPGGQVSAVVDSLVTEALLPFHRPQNMVAAGRHCVGRSDSLGLESVLLIRMDYQPVSLWSPPPVADAFTAYLSFKMDNRASLAWFPQVSPDPPELGESARYLDLELLLVADSLGYDGLAWEDAFADGELRLGVLDRIQFRVSSADTAFGDGSDPLTGRRTWRALPAAWFQPADTSSRLLLLRALPGQQGFTPILGAGWAAELRPRVRFASMRIDTILVDNVQVPDTVRDTSFVAATWQTSLIRDTAAPGRLTLSTGWAGQVLAQLPPFPPDADNPAYDPVGSTLTEAWLRVPLADPGYNVTGAKVNLYAVSLFDSAGVDLNADQLIATRTIADGDSLLQFNLTPHLRRIWINDDSLRNTDPIRLALKLDDYNLLQPRQVGLADPLQQPTRLFYTISRAPDSWGRP